MKSALRLLDYFTGSLADYHVGNLQEALKVAPSTGDWHGELLQLLTELQIEEGLKPYANVPAEQQVKAYGHRSR